MRYKTTTTGSRLPDRWVLPESMRYDTGIIFASAFPGCDALSQIMSSYYEDRDRRDQLKQLEELRPHLVNNGHGSIAQEIERRISDLKAEMERKPFRFDRRFLFRVLSMGHSQLAEYIGARGPNTQINAACASTTQAVSLAEDWIHAGRCRRVIVVAADDVTSDNMLPWWGSAFLASGVAATDDSVEKAALPFDKRRHGMLIGMGAAGLVVESSESAKMRGIRSICEVVATVTANSAFHGTRLDVNHIGQVMEDLMTKAEASGFDRTKMASNTVFVSHETYTPARGGSASAEIFALRKVFGNVADKVVIANTKGFTGHAMATGIEDVLAVKALETGCVPPVANFKEVDPELGQLNLSRGGSYPVEFALRLGAGFGSQISMSLLRWMKPQDGRRMPVNALGFRNRIADEATWNAWLSSSVGIAAPELEVVNRTLRVKQAVSALASLSKTAQAVEPAVLPAESVVAPPVIEEKLEPVKAAALTPLPIVAPEPAVDRVRNEILELVSQKTGYPGDMLDVELDLEADLGVDTVKQAEVFASIREKYNIPRQENLKLREFPTLRHVIQFVYDHRPDLKSAMAEVKAVEPVSAAVAAAEPAPAALSDAVQERILALVVEKTGYPREMLDVELDLEADLGVDTVKQAEMFAAIRETYNIPRDESIRLRDFPTLKHVIGFVYAKRPDLAAAPAAAAKEVAPVVTTPTDAAEVAKIAEADEITARVLDLVAEKTGYPKDMLDLDLDLEADLGVDTVKQAEMFASIRAIWSIPRDENLKLRDFPTLKHVIQFARERSGAVVKSATPIAATTQSVAAAAEVHRVLAAFDTAAKVPRRVPVPVLRPSLGLCKPTGVTLGVGSRILVMPDENGIASVLIAKLQALGVDVLTFQQAPEANELAASLKEWLAAGPIQGVYWLPALDHEGAITGLSWVDWKNKIDARLKNLYRTMRALYEQIATPATFLISATRLGGQHGYDAAGAFAPMGGAVAGFTKAFKREKTDATVKVVDFAADTKAMEITDLLLAETQQDPGAVEIGYKNDLRWTIALQEQPVVDGHPGLILDANSVFVVTGAAGSIVSAITADLAAASSGTFYLLDLVPEPDAKSDDLKLFATDKEALKRDLTKRLSAGQKRVTPAMVEKELALLERQQAAQAAIEAVHAAGGTAMYRSVNLTDADGVRNILHEVREKHGRVDVLLHAAGIERSHFLPDKEAKEFDLVFDVKADGFFNLIHAIGDTPLGAAVVFSSIAGRFGNGGQADYSSANDLMCKFMSSFRTERPATRGIAIDWTAWGKIGMATRGSIPKMMEVAGIDMLDPTAGVPWIRRELTEGGTRGEVVVAERLGILLEELDATGGLDLAALEKSREQLPTPGPMIGKITGMGIHRGLTMETTLDPNAQPFLYDHRIDGTPVLPGVMGIETFAEAALCVHPGWHIEGIEEVNFLAPFKFYKDEPRTLCLEAVFRPEGDRLVAECRLIGRRSLATQTELQQTTHFTARVRLTPHAPQSALGTAPHLSPETIVDSAEIYRIYFHGPAYQVLERAWWDGAHLIGEMAAALPVNHEPSALPTQMSPRLIELCFQTAGLWEMGAKGRMGLPTHVQQVAGIKAPQSVEGRLYAMVTPHPEQETFDAEVVDTSGNRYLRLEGYKTSALPVPLDADTVSHLQRLLTPGGVTLQEVH